MRLSEVEVTEHRARLWGARAVVEVESPLEGVLRIRHAPHAVATSVLHPALPPKASWAVVPRASTLPIRSTVLADEVHVEGPGTAVVLRRDPLAWRFTDPSGCVLAACERVEGEAHPGYPQPRYTTSLSLHAPPGEAYFGFGEKVGPLDKRGLRFSFWNTDVMPHLPDTDPLYVSIPFFVALRGGVAWGFFLDETHRTDVDVAAVDPERVRWSSTGPELDVYLLAGPTPADVLRRYVDLTGRMPLPPLWSLGAQQSRWGYENADEVLAVLEAYRRWRLPLDVVYLDIDHQDGYRTLTWDRTRYPNPAALARAAREQGARLVTIVDPALAAEEGYPLYEEARAGDYLVRTDRGPVLRGQVWPSPAVFPDFTNEAVQRFWGEAHRAFVEAGIAGIWTDMNEPSCFTVEAGPKLSPSSMPFHDPDARVGKTLPDYARHGTRRHLEVHNVYGLAMAKATFEGLARLAPERRPFVLTRAGFAGMQRYAAVWTGDNSSYWSHLELSIPMLLGLGLSGVPFSGADVPGFLGWPTPELFVRWMQLGAFYPLFRNHAAKGAPPQEPWRFGEPWVSLARAVLEMRYRLLPILYTLMHEASETGVPPLRALMLEEPTDPQAVSVFDQFFFGAHLLVAPVVRPGATKRLAYLPAGDWLPWSVAGSLGPSVSGGQWHVADAPLARIPLWLRAGSAVPITEPALFTTSARWATLTWHVAPGPRIRGALYEDEGDGYGPSLATTLEGAATASGLTLERNARGPLGPARREEVLRIFGFGAARRVEGALASVRDGDDLVVAVDGAWSRVSVEL